MDAARTVVGIDPIDRRLGINALGELVLLQYTPLGPIAFARAVDNGQGWLRYVPITNEA